MKKFSLFWQTKPFLGYLIILSDSIVSTVYVSHNIWSLTSLQQNISLIKDNTCTCINILNNVLMSFMPQNFKHEEATIPQNSVVCLNLSEKGAYLQQNTVSYENDKLLLWYQKLWCFQSLLWMVTEKKVLKQKTSWNADAHQTAFLNLITKENLDNKQNG